MHKYLNKYIVLKYSLLGLLLLCLMLSFDTSAAGKFNTQKRYLYIQPGQSIFSIVKVLYPDQRAQWPRIIKKVVRINPHAFIGADATKILPGERIELPAISSKIKPVTYKPSPDKPVVLKKIHAVGQVIKTRGKTFSISKKNKKLNLEVGSEIYVGDRIYTGVKGFIRLNMIDEAKIDLRCNSEMLIEDYQLLNGGNRSVIYLIKGSVKKISGSIGKMAEDIYEMHTPLATVGVRGTEYAIRVLQQHGCDGSLDVNSKGLFIKVSKGAIDIETETQDQELKEDETIYLEKEGEDLQKIEVQDAVFEPVIQEKKKSHLSGSIFWLIFFMPLILMFRKLIKYEH